MSTGSLPRFLTPSAPRSVPPTIQESHQLEYARLRHDSPTRAGNCATGGNQRVREFGPANALSDRVFPGSLRASIALCQIGSRRPNRGIAGNLDTLSQ